MRHKRDLLPNEFALFMGVGKSTHYQGENGCRYKQCEQINVGTYGLSTGLRLKIASHYAVLILMSTLFISISSYIPGINELTSTMYLEIR